MVPAAAVPPAAEAAMENHLLEGRRRLRGRIGAFLLWLGREGARSTPAQAQKRLVVLKLRFNAVISQFYIFAAVLTQRSEHETGVWIAGLDDLAADAISLPGGYYRPPPVVCYIDRGHGGAIRRARTRLPGGDPNPIRSCGTRMIAMGIGSPPGSRVRSAGPARDCRAGTRIPSRSSACRMNGWWARGSRRRWYT